MKRKSWTRVTRDILLDAPLPQATETYTVISHSFCINTIKKLLSIKGFTVVNEIYSATDGAQIATGLFHINHGTDPELGMLFAFANSYNKKVKFSCSVGAYVKVNETSILTEGGSAWIRKHTGNADELAEEVVKQQVEDAAGYFDQLLKDKEAMKQIRLNQTQYAELIGRLYLDVQILAIGQVSHIKGEYNKPSYTYNADNNSLWTLYNHILLALTKSHPRTWMEQQKLVHLHISTMFDLTQFDEVVDDTVMEDGALQPNTLQRVDPETGEKIGDPVYVGDDDTDQTEEYVKDFEATDVKAEVPAEEDEETEILTDEDIAEHEELEEVVDPAQTDVVTQAEEVEAAGVENVSELDAEEVDEISPEDLEAAAEVHDRVVAEAKEEQPPKPTITMKEATERYADLITEEEAEQMLTGKASEELLNRVKAAYLADQEAEAALTEVVTDQIEEVVTEGFVENWTDTKSYLPQDPSKLQEKLDAEIEAIQEEEVGEVVDETETEALDRLEAAFFMTRADLSEMCEDELAIGVIVVIGDDECEIVSKQEDHTSGDIMYGLSPLIAEEAHELDPPEGLVEMLEEVEEEVEAIVDGFPEPESTEMDMSFEIGDAGDTMVPSENMLSTKSQSIESVTDVNDEEQKQIDEALAKMEAKVELTPAEQAIHDAIKSEIYELYGEEYEFTYKLNGGQFTVTLETEETFVLEKTYVESLNQNV